MLVFQYIYNVNLIGLELSTYKQRASLWRTRGSRKSLGNNSSIRKTESRQTASKSVSEGKVDQLSILCSDH